MVSLSVFIYWTDHQRLQFRWILGGCGKECRDGISFSALDGNAEVPQDMNLVKLHIQYNQGFIRNYGVPQFSNPPKLDKSENHNS